MAKQSQRAQSRDRVSPTQETASTGADLGMDPMADGGAQDLFGNARLSEMIHLSASGSPAGGDPNAAFNASTSGGGQGVPYKAEMESAFGQDFSGVKAFTGQKAGMDALGAHAAARGDQVAFASSSPDRETVAHELTHVVQARQGGVSLLSKTSQPGDASEREAQRVASEVASGGSAHVEQAPTGQVQGDFLGIGDALGLRDNEEGLDEWEDYQDAMEEYDEFVAETYTSEDFSSSTGLGSFDATYNPGAGTLEIECRCKFNFVDGTATEFPDAAPEDLVWSDEAKEQWKNNFVTDVSSAWSGAGAHTFFCQQDWWESLQAVTTVSFLAVDDDEHYEVSVTKIPPGGFRQSSVTAPGIFSSGSADLDSEDMTAVNKPGGVQRGGVHEGGHMLGLGDEYEGLDGDVYHSDMVEEDWGHSVARGTDGRVMSGGEDIQPEHGVTMLEALKDATDMDEWGPAAKTPRPVPADPSLEGVGDFPTPPADGPAYA